MENYGPIEVSQLREDVLAHYTVRTFKIRHTRLRCGAGKQQQQGRQHSERFVLQYHFTWWPESGCVPDDPMPLLNFVRYESYLLPECLTFYQLTKHAKTNLPLRKSSAVNRDSDRPIVVHCSAGVGRTGVYIVIDAMLRQMKCKCELGLVTYLMHIRTQRNYLVQVRDMNRY